MNDRVRLVVSVLLCILLLACNAVEPTEIPDDTGSRDYGMPKTNAMGENAMEGVQYLSQSIAPCTPIPNSTVDPCEPMEEVIGISDPSKLLVADYQYPPASVEDLLVGPSGLFVTHLVARATYLPGSVRCAFGYDFRLPSFANQAWPESISVVCFVDVRINEYIIGSGPTELTTIVARRNYWESEDGVQGQSNREDGDVLRTAFERALIEGGRFRYGENWLEELTVNGPSGGLAGREVVLFLSPHTNAMIESWSVLHTWDVQRRENEGVVVLHPHRFDYPDRAEDPLFEFDLAAFKRAVLAAQESRLASTGGRTRQESGYPMLVTDANNLRQYFREVGAYDDPDKPPAQPPPVPECATGAAVADPNANRGTGARLLEPACGEG